MDQQVSQLQNALATMYSNAEYSAKQQANNYLQQYRLSNEAWTISHLILNDDSAKFDIQTKLFAAQTLRAKINFNLAQLPQENVSDLKDSLLNLILIYTTQNIKVIRTQLNISLVSLALQHLSWDNPVSDIISVFENLSQQNSSLTDSYLASLLEFLKILPEECSDINKTPLTDNEFQARTDVLITKNRSKVLQLLIQLSTANNKQISAAVLDCLNSWIAEIPITKILSTEPLYQLIFNNLLHEQNFELSIEALISIIKETKDIENIELISKLYQELIKVRPLLFNNFDNFEIVNGLARLFVEIGESWNAFIIKNPEYFKELIEILLKCCEYREDLDIIKYTFNFWYLSSSLLASPTYSEQRQIFVPVYHRLTEIIIEQLRYPESDNGLQNGNETTRELFDGDLESEEKFKDFRYEMGDVLKECCYIVGANEALAVPFNKIQQIAQNDGANLTWQDVEAPLFSMRSMAKEVNPREDNAMLNQTFELLLQLIQSNSKIIHFNKIKYAIILVFGRYSEYTYYHANFLKPQLDFILHNLTNVLSGEQNVSLNDSQKEIVTAASNSLMFFCQDCCDLLIPYLNEFFDFYITVRNNPLLDLTSLYEITDGFAHIIYSQESDEAVYNSAKIFIEPTLKELSVYAENAAQLNQTKNEEDEIYKNIADKIELVTVLLSILKPKDPQANTNKIADLVIEIYPVIQLLFDNFKLSFKVSERLIKFLRTQIENFTTYLIPILTQIIDLVNEGYKTTKFGCYLWITGIIIREFNDDYVNDEVKQVVYDFGKLQGQLFLAWLNEYFKDVNITLLLSNAQTGSYELVETERKTIVDKLINIEDKIEDFFRMMGDLLTYFPFKLLPELAINDSLSQHSFQIAILSLNLDKYDPIVSVIRYIMDFISWGNEVPPVSLYRENPADIRELVCKYLLSPPSGATNSSVDTNALLLFNICFKGLLFKFPVDAKYETYDLISKLVKLIFAVSNNDVGLIKVWVEFCIDDLPANTVSTQEKFKVLSGVETALSSKNFRKFKMSLKDFIGYYVRKNVNNNNIDNA